MKKQTLQIGFLTLSTLGFGVALAQSANLSVVKNYLLERLSIQKSGSSSLKTAAQRYYDLAKNTNFDYNKLASGSDAVRNALKDARDGWKKASPVYESVEGIVAGVEMLSIFDVNLDAGMSKTEGGESIVTFDLKLPNGKILEKPGNLFGVTEGALWASEKTFSSGVKFDVDVDGKIGFGDALPDANILKAAADKLDSMTADLIATGKTWTPTLEDVFGALTANVPTAAPVFIDRWRTSRFVLGDAATRRDFNAISSLNDLNGNISSWQTLYKGLAPAVADKNASLNKQITDGLNNLKTWVTKLESQEKTRRFSPEQAELILKESDNRATAITGKIVQAAALLGVKVSN
jgi:Imelysin